MNSSDLSSWAPGHIWFTWAVGLIVLFPLLIVVLGEVIHKMEKSQSKWLSPIKNLRHLVLPQLVFLLIMTRILGLDAENVWVRVVETALWIFIIHTSLGILNTLLFSGANEDPGNWQGRVPKLVVDFARVVLVMIGAALVLSSVWGIDLGRMLAALGVGSIVLGLALQDTLGSLFSGFALLSSKQFRVGDWLNVGDNEEGKIIDMNWRTVTLLNRDEDIIIVPNAELAKGKFVNYTYPYPRHREKVQFDFSFDDAPYLVKKALKEAALATPGILADPEPVIALISYDEFSVKHEVLYFIEDYVDQPRILDDFKSRVWYVAKRYGISFPTRAHEVFMMESAIESQDQSRSEIESQLIHLPFLKSKQQQVALLAESAKKLDYATGERIIAQDEMTDYLYVVSTGKATESFIDGLDLSHDLNILQTNDFFGLAALVRNEPSDVSITCETDMQVIAIKRDAIQHLFEMNPELAVEMEKVLENRTREVRTLQRAVRKSQLQQLAKEKQNETVVDIQSVLKL